jgi:hypothetical protein
MNLVSPAGPLKRFIFYLRFGTFFKRPRMKTTCPLVPFNCRFIPLKRILSEA